MSYIRTKNFIHNSKDVVVVNENGTLVVLRGIDKDFVERTHGKTWNTGTNVVLAQKNTIKELCDSWILVDRDNVQPIAFNINEDSIAKTYKDNKDKHNFTLFAAIWVFDSNGAPTLKPVAKMNENGDLELYENTN